MVREIHVERIEPSPAKPMAVVGAGPLTSAIWKTGDEDAGWRYRFNLFRLLARKGRVSQIFLPGDLVHFVKLIQVLAAVIADDGCLTQIERETLTRLAAELDDVVHRSARHEWGGVDSRGTRPSSTNTPMKGPHDGNSTHL